MIRIDVMETLLSLTLMDYIFVALVLTGLIVGLSRGFIDLLTGFVAFIVATIVAGRYTHAMVQLLNRHWGAQDYLADVVKRRIKLPPEATTLSAADIPWEKATTLMRDLPLPEIYKEALATRLVEWTDTAGGQTVADFIVGQLSYALLGGLVFICMATVITWLLAMLGRLVGDQVKEIPVVGTGNRLLGGAISTFQVVLGIALFIAIVSPLLSLWGLSSVTGAVEEAFLAPYFMTLYDSVKGFWFDASSNLFMAA